ncbi:MAG: RNA-dependent RNA polymerase [Hangzhou totivirus 10]|nr:MAG: RNA-dependent RNA polymerase [Hangzhou totivirus 10]
MYHIHVADSFFNDYVDPTELRSRPRNVDALRRYWGTVPKWWPCGNKTDCAWPLYLHYLSIKECGQVSVAQELYYCLDKIRSRWRKYVKKNNITDPDKYVEDYYRLFLKALSGHCYPQVFEKGPAYMLLCHLHALNAKAPYTEKQILSDIDSWVSDTLDGKKKSIHMDTFREVLLETLAAWPKKTEDAMTYEEFANDPFRWGTSGGAPVVEMHGAQVRSKWAWAMSQKIHPTKGITQVNLAQEAEKAQKYAHIALKEEAQKTREIITTPISSYLRQTYLMYLLGKPPVPSPISSPNWLPTFELGDHHWYGCIDGERFDHSVPKEAILTLIDTLGNISDEARRVADAEIAHINQLQIDWGNKKWKYEGGLLSGWRFTSLLGSIVSLAAARYVLRATNKIGAVSVGVMGDDVVFTSNTTSISAEDMVREYNAFGLKANLSKTVSGPQGEFLRKVRSKGGSWAFPALDLKTITHSNPWIENFQFAQEEECANSWHVLTSRLLPHATDPNRIANWTQKHCIANLNSVFGKRKGWEAWLQTPMTAGGGGYLENSSYREWHIITKQKDQPHLTPFEKLGQLVGTLPTKKTIKKIELNAVSLSVIRSYENKTLLGEDEMYIPRFKHNTCITAVMWRLLTNSITVAELNKHLVTHLPHRMRMYSGSRLASLLSTAKKSIDSLPSIVHTKEAIPRASQTLTSVTKHLMARKSGIPSLLIRPLATLFAVKQYRDVLVPYGTW